MPRYKRTRDEAELDVPDDDTIPPEQQETLARLRNMWELASLHQFIFLFGECFGLSEDFDMDVRFSPKAREWLAKPCPKCCEMDTDDGLMTGPRGRMPQDRAL